MSRSDEQFWREKGHLHLRPNQAKEEFPGGFDLLGVIASELGECSRVLEVGCGDGRLSEAFIEGQYLGLDVNTHNIHNARVKHPLHMFRLCGYDDAIYPDADAILAHGLLLHIPDSMIEIFVARLTLAAPIILVGEILGRPWHDSTAVPPVYNRNLEEYCDIFAECGFQLTKHLRYPYEWYVKRGDTRNTDMSFLRFEAKDWDHD
jgi:SAM-dependent methyltransferase